MKLRLAVVSIFVFALTACATTPQSYVNMKDPVTYVKVNFLKSNYDEVIRYGRSLGPIPNKNDYLSILQYIGVSQLERRDFEGARKTFELLKTKDTEKKFQDFSDVRIADSYFLDQKYYQAYPMYLSLINTYPKSSYLPYIYYRTVLTSQKTGNFDRAKEFYRLLEKRFPDSLESMRLQTIVDPMDLEGYSVQVGSFSDKKKSAQMQSGLLKKGYIVSVREVKSDNTTFYRVRIHCRTRAEAESVASALRAEGHPTKVYP